MTVPKKATITYTNGQIKEIEIPPEKLAEIIEFLATRSSGGQQKIAQFVIKLESDPV
jgi:hypothetical protein